MTMQPSNYYNNSNTIKWKCEEILIMLKIKYFVQQVYGKEETHISTSNSKRNSLAFPITNMNRRGTL